LDESPARNRNGSGCRSRRLNAGFYWGWSLRGNRRACYKRDASGQISHCICLARARPRRPADQAVGNIGSIAMCSDTRSQVSTCIDGARVVNPSSFVVHADIRSTTLGEALLQAVSARGPTNSILNHLGNLAGWTRMRHFSIVAGSCSIVSLHQPRIANAIVCGGCSNAAIAFLHYDSKNESRVDTSGAGNGLDASRHCINLIVGVICNAPLCTRA